MNVEIGRMLTTDWEEVREIYRLGIETRNATFETQPPTWEQWDAGHLQECRLVARSGERVTGWAALAPVSKREVYSGVAEVSVYVNPDYQGLGIGRQLLEEIIKVSEQNGFWTLQSGTFPENAASIALQKSCGFREIGRRERVGKHYGVWRDTILMERRSSLIT